VRSNLPWFSRNAIAMGAVALSVGVLAACSGSSSSPSAGMTDPAATGPITIGASLSLTGSFSLDGGNFQRGYEQWAADVNAHGGIMGRQVDLKILDDKSSPNQVVSNYQTLINTYHEDLVFGPYSSLLTGPAAAVAARNGYAFVEGAGGAPSVFDTSANQADHNVFDVSLPIEDTMMPFVTYIESLPLSQRQQLTAAYPMVQDPFADPPVQLTEQKLHSLGVQTKYSQIFAAQPSSSSYQPEAAAVAQKRPDIVVLGSADVPTVQEFMKVFEQHNYTPKMFLAAAGPDQGSQFTTAVHATNATGMMVPNGWYPGFPNAASRAMVAEYAKQNKVSASSVGADVAEAYSVGQVIAQAIEKTGGTDNTKIVQYLHSGVTLSTVQGPVQFNSLGENGAAAAFIFQWQSKGTRFVQVLPQGSGIPSIVNKAAWAAPIN
jgi:branched-chain amino acid transport system substrate-binding protein